MIFVDSGAWYASVIVTDPDHIAATAWLSQNREPMITSDYVLDETLTLLRARGHTQIAIPFGNRLLSGRVAKLHIVDLPEVEEAFQVFVAYADKEWSFTDCVSFVLIRKFSIGTAFSFDHHFRQFGICTVVP
jgi:predicted nucleic acid-binding protein